MRTRPQTPNVSYDGPRGSQEHPDQYRRLFESVTNYAIFALTADGRIANWNAGARQTFGYEEHEVLGENYALLFTADDIARGRPAAELQASLKLGVESVDGWHLRKDGNRFWCTDTIQPLRDELGAVTGYTKVVRDSDEAHTATERLRESEERLRLLIEGVVDYAIFSIDEGGLIRVWNTGAERVFGYAEADVLGKHFSLVYTPQARSRGVPAAELNAAASLGHVADEGWYERRNGERFYASGETTRLRPDADGNPRGFVKIAHDVTVRNATEEANKHLAFHDQLTTLPNRASFCDFLRRSIARFARSDENRFAVIFIDLDRFKIVNDSLGHVMADGLLVHAARTLEQCVRPGDVVARLGGDEFAILLSDLEEIGEAAAVADRVQIALQRPFDLGGFEVFTSASMGIALGSDAYDKPEEILRDADTAMYQAKERGRAQYVLFDEAMHDHAVGLLHLQMDLRRAVAREEFFVEYQPIVALEQRRLVGFEALVRWNHPVRGPLQPRDFLAEAESIGLIIEIDRWVLREACKQLRAWQIHSGDETLSVSVNLSSRQFAHEGLIEEIREAVRSNQLTPQSLKLEITETVLMEQFDAISATMAQVVDLGVELYIDDFGTGYSSLSYLTRFPLKLLKVDRSFVSQISSNPRSAVVARTVVALAHSLGVAALAEGIETAQQLTKLQELGCEYGQGYWLSRPVAADVAEALIGNRLPLKGRATAG